jgi:hypothetical protein
MAFYNYEQNIEMLEEKDICKNCAYQNRIPMALILLTMLLLTTENLTAAVLSLRRLLLLGERAYLVCYNYHITV